MDCTIRKWRLSDAGDLAAAVSNEKVLDNLRDGLPFPYTEQDGAEYISAMLAADENETFAFAISVDGKAVGSISVFRQANIHRRTAELGYYIAEEYWGKGIMTDAVKQLKEKELTDLQTRSQEFQQMAQQELQSVNEQLMAPIYEKAKTTVDEVAKANGYTYVFDASALIYMAPDASDLMPLVKSKLGI